MTDRELMGQALLALELWRDALTDPAANHALRYASFGHDAAKALRDRLAQPEPKPVAWLVQFLDRHEFMWGSKPNFFGERILGVEPLYTADAIEAAVKAEREACARLAEEVGYDGLGCRCALEAVEAIRARGQA